MGGSGYKKFKKQEKARVKLKGNKTLLPKGQNVTDTSFKVKKIIVKEQLKGHGENELLTRKHLNIKELISRLSHHNVGMRQDALSGLKELVAIHGPDIVQANLSALLHAAVRLIVDVESDVRKESVKLLAAVFDKVTEEELSPLFPLVASHLTCAMTHIEPRVREDSLRLLDTMLAALPGLTAAHTTTLLPHCLDLLGGRSLSLHLGGRLTSEKWRGRVIGRLNKLFSVILQHARKDQKQTVPSVQWMHDKRTYLGLYSSIMTKAPDAENVANLPMKEYTDLLMPLLLDTFTEAVPKRNQGGAETACVIGEDITALLQSIVEVILRIWQLLNHTSQAESLTEWFQQKWGESVVSRIVSGRFPYSVSTAGGRKRKREAELMLAALQVSQPSSLLLNLQLSLLTFSLTPPGDSWTESIQYIKRSLRRKGPLKQEESVVLCECLEAACAQPLPAETLAPSLLSVITKSDILSGSSNRRAFHFLTDIALQHSHHLHQDEHLKTWLDSLPSLLCKPTVPLAFVRSIAAIASRNLPVFNNSLDGWLEEILGNLSTLKILGDHNNEGHKLIINLVYWVKDWDKEMAQSIKQLIKQNLLGPGLTRHLLDIISIKVENTDDSEIKTILEEVLLQVDKSS